MCGAPLAAASVGVFAEGGYAPGARVTFGAAAIASLMVVLALGGRAPLRSPVVVVLIALAALGALSALWTIGPLDRTLQWALVTAGYAAVALGAAAVARRHGAIVVTGGLALLAMASGAAGLVGVALHEAPYAERVAGVWRPGGPFEYAPALALLQVSALPGLLYGMQHRSRVVAGTAAVGLALAGGVLAQSASRLGVAMALVVAGLALAFPEATGRARRGVVGAALAIGLASGLVVAAAPAALPVVLAAAPAWLLVRAWAERRPGRSRALPRLVVVGAIVAAALVVGALAFGPATGRGMGARSDVLHGRAETWRAALETWGDRPLRGTGADAFLTGSARHQGGATILFAHDLPLEFAAELGVAGLALALALYAATLWSVWRARANPAAWLLGPAAIAFMAANLVDWPWHLAGSGAVWALSVGGLAGAAMSAHPALGSTQVPNRKVPLSP